MTCSTTPPQGNAGVTPPPQQSPPPSRAARGGTAFPQGEVPANRFEVTSEANNPQVFPAHRVRLRELKHQPSPHTPLARQLSGARTTFGIFKAFSSSHPLN